MRKFLSKIARKILLGGLIVGCIFSTAEAKEIPTVTWDHDIYTMIISGEDDRAEKKRSYQLLNTGVDATINREKISDAIAAKLKLQEDKLPFKLKTSMNMEDISLLNAEQNDISMDSPFALVPMIVTDFAIDNEYIVQGEHYHRYLIVSAVDIAFCSEDEDGALTILSNIPLHFYMLYPSSNSLSSMSERDRSELARIYTDFTIKMINQHLDFTKSKKLVEKAFKIRDDYGATETYRVEDVIYGSKKAAELFGQNKLIQRIIGNIFTSDYANLTGNVVYPSAISADWTIDASSGMYAHQMSSTRSGARKVLMPKEVDHKIILNVTGIGSNEVQTKQISNINGFRAYKVWLKCVMDGKSFEVTNDIIEEYIKDRSKKNSIEKGEQEIYGGLMIGAAVDIAKKVAGKK